VCGPQQAATASVGYTAPVGTSLPTACHHVGADALG
jgi:hypothetical protein